MNLDSAKENIQPLACGRNIERLEIAINAESHQEIQMDLLKQRSEFEHAILHYTGDDPLELWYEYISWLEQSYPKSGKESAIDVVITECLTKFDQDERYNQDRRMLKLYIKYIDTQTNPVELYQMLYNHGIGTMIAELYICWAHYYDLDDNFEKTEAVFRKGFDARAQPLDQLDLAHKQFGFSMSQRLLHKDETSKQLFRSSMEERRFALTSLRSDKHKHVGSIRTGNAVKSYVPGRIEQSKTDQLPIKNNTKVNVYEDENQNPNIRDLDYNMHVETEATTQPTSIAQCILNSAKIQENTIEPGPWTNPKQTKGSLYNNGSRTLVNESKMKFSIMEDDEDDIAIRQLEPIPMTADEEMYSKGIQLLPNFIDKNDPLEPFDPPMYIHDELKPGQIPMYDKFLVCPSNDKSFSLEESMAYKWFKKNDIINKFVIEQDKIWGNGSDIKIRLPPNFIKQNDKITDDETKWPLYEEHENIKNNLCKFNIDTKLHYPDNCEEEFSYEEILRKKWLTGEYKIRKEQPPIEEHNDENTIYLNEDLNETNIITGRFSINSNVIRKSVIPGGRKSIMPLPSSSSSIESPPVTVTNEIDNDKKMISTGAIPKRLSRKSFRSEMTNQLPTIPETTNNNDKQLFKKPLIPLPFQKIISASTSPPLNSHQEQQTIQSIVTTIDNNNMNDENIDTENVDIEMNDCDNKIIGNDTCSTQIFNLFIQEHSSSTPKAIKKSNPPRKSLLIPQQLPIPMSYANTNTDNNSDNNKINTVEPSPSPQSSDDDKQMCSPDEHISPTGIICSSYGNPITGLKLSTIMETTETNTISSATGGSTKSSISPSYCNNETEIKLKLETHGNFINNKSNKLSDKDYDYEICNVNQIETQKVDDEFKNNKKINDFSIYTDNTTLINTDPCKSENSNGKSTVLPQNNDDINNGISNDKENEFPLKKVIIGNLITPRIKEDKHFTIFEDDEKTEHQQPQPPLPDINETIKCIPTIEMPVKQLIISHQSPTVINQTIVPTITTTGTTTNIFEIPSLPQIDLCEDNTKNLPPKECVPKTPIAQTNKFNNSDDFYKFFTETPIKKYSNNIINTNNTIMDKLIMTPLQEPLNITDWEKQSHIKLPSIESSIRSSQFTTDDTSSQITEIKLTTPAKSISFTSNGISLSARKSRIPIRTNVNLTNNSDVQLKIDSNDLSSTASLLEPLKESYIISDTITDCKFNWPEFDKPNNNQTNNVSTSKYYFEPSLHIKSESISRNSGHDNTLLIEHPQSVVDNVENDKILITNVQGNLSFSFTETEKTENIQNNQTLCQLINDQPIQSNQQEDHDVEQTTDDDDTADNDVENSIYIYKTEPKYTIEKHGNWEEINENVDDNGGAVGGDNFYIQNVDIDVERTEQLMTGILNGIDIDPFDKQLRFAFMEKIEFIDYLKDLKTCSLVNRVVPLKPNTSVNFNNIILDVIKLIGEGSYGHVFMAKCNKTRKYYALKQERPANVWEYYICLEIESRITPAFLPGFMTVKYSLIGNNASILASDFSEFGTILNVCNRIKLATNKNMDEYIVMILACEMLLIIDHLHAAKIIHADIKPDNFLLMKKIVYGSTELSIQLIDFGQSIDLKLFSNPNQTFRTKIRTSNFMCTEMVEDKPWSYQTDLYCLAGTIHSMLFGKYMKVTKDSYKKYSIVTKIPRYLKSQLWTEIFDQLINISDVKCMPNLQRLRVLLKQEITMNESQVKTKIYQFNSLMLK